jgi:excinuclease ABC subunit C
LLGQKNFYFRPYATDGEGLKEALMTALIDYYQHCADSLPSSIFVPDDELKLENESQGWDAVMNASEAVRPKIRSVSRAMQSFAQLTREQAMENQRMRLSLDEQRWKASTTLKELLQLEKNPERLECYDIAIWQGQAPTAARISFWRGHPDRKEYRHYHLQQLPEGNNDFAMMKEVLQRRLVDGEMPDAIILDGGKGQLAIGQEVLRELTLNIPIFALAKEKNKGPKSKGAKVEERIYLPGRSNPIILARHPELMRLLVQMRDEAHRFSRKLHHKQMKKEFFQNPIDHLPGLSSKQRAKLLEACRQHCQGDVKLLLQWSKEEIAQRLDVSQKIAENMWEALHKLE